MAILNSTQMFFTAFEPKLQNRFLMNIDGIDAYLIKKIDRPNISFSEITLDHINVKRVEEWILKGAYCQAANFGSLDWSTSEPVSIALTIVMDYAILNY